MQPDKLRQRKKADEKSASRRAPFGGGGNREQREDLSIPVFRSPALESAQRQKAQVKSAKETARRTPSGGSPRRTTKSKVTYAADDTLGYSGISGPSRKSLPNLRSRVSNAGLPAVVPPSGVPSNERR